MPSRAENSFSNFFNGWLCALLLLLAGSVSRAQPVILHLVNGDRISGTIVSESNTNITLATAALGKLSVPVTEVLKREKAAVAAHPSATSTNLALNGVKPSVAPTPPGPVAGTNAPPKVVDLSKTSIPKPAVPATPAKAKGPKHWNTDLQMGLNLRYSTTDQQEYLAILKTTYVKDRLKENLDYSFSYGKTEGLLSANRMTGGSKTSYDLSKRWYVFNLVGGGYDEIRKIDLQYELGPGMGFQVINSTNHNFVFNSELGFSYQEQFRADDTDQITYSARLAELITWKIWDKLTADAKIEIFPNMQALGDYRLRIEGSLRYPLLKNISLNLILIDLYDTLPAKEVSNNDLQIRSALGVKF